MATPLLIVLFISIYCIFLGKFAEHIEKKRKRKGPPSEHNPQDRQ